MQAQDGGSILRFLFPFRPVAARQKHRRTLGETVHSYRKMASLSQEKLAERADLRYGVSLTDSCISWETTERILRWGYETLAKVAQSVISAA